MGYKKLRVFDSIHIMKSLHSLDYWTSVSLESIWKAQVAQCIEASKTGDTIQDDTSPAEDDWEFINSTDEEWEFIDNTIIAEPFWGHVVNRN